MQVVVWSMPSSVCHRPLHMAHFLRSPKDLTVRTEGGLGFGAASAESVWVEMGSSGGGGSGGGGRGGKFDESERYAPVFFAVGLPRSRSLNVVHLLVSRSYRRPICFNANVPLLSILRKFPDSLSELSESLIKSGRMGESLELTEYLAIISRAAASPELDDAMVGRMNAWQ